MDVYPRLSNEDAKDYDKQKKALLTRCKKIVTLFCFHLKDRKGMVL